MNISILTVESQYIFNLNSCQFYWSNIPPKLFVNSKSINPHYSTYYLQTFPYTYLNFMCGSFFNQPLSSFDITKMKEDEGLYNDILYWL